ncbi:MAG: hypothetical protein RIR26_2920 [Pseudomonadota bacterium]|jgi:hypothetical protein
MKSAARLFFIDLLTRESSSALPKLKAMNQVVQRFIAKQVQMASRFGGGVNNVPLKGSLKSFPFWESMSQAPKEESWIAFEQVSQRDWFGKCARSTTCQGGQAGCKKLIGCGPGYQPYINSSTLFPRQSFISQKNPLGGPFEENIWHRRSSMQPM